MDSEPSARSLFRIIRHRAASREDFLSDDARGKPLPLDPRMTHLHGGISMFATLEQALKKAQRYPVLGRYVAEVRLQASDSVRFERTIERSQGHHTVWADPDALLQCVVHVYSVDGEIGGMTHDL